MTESLVSREAEREALSAALAHALAGHGSVVTLTGEAGIGKTALARTLAEEADAAGALTALGAGWAGGGAPAFWPFSQVLRTIASALDDELLRAAMGSGAPYLGHLVPQLRARHPEAGEPAELESDQARFRLFDAVVDFLRAVAYERPLLILLDDLHAADLPSLRLLDFVARHVHTSRILVLALHQEAAQTEAGALLAELSRHTERLRLDGLDPGGVTELVGRHTNRDAAPELAAQIHELTGGNPFFTCEVVRLMAAEPAGTPLRLPASVRATIRRRLEPVSDATVAVLEAAAVIGMQFRVETLARATGYGRAVVQQHLDEAAAAGLVATSGIGADRYEFAHSLIRETLYADLVPSRRAQLHAEVGTALEHVYGDSVEDHVGEVSHHLLAAGDERGPELAERAGRRELGRLAFEQAERHFARALAAVREQQPAGERVAGLLLALGEAQMRAGRPAEARASLRESAEIAGRLGLDELFARAVLAMVPWGFNVRVADADLARLVGEALDRLAEDHPVLRARLMSTLARTTYWTGDLEGRLELVQRAIALARDSGDEPTLARVLGDAHIATWNPDANDRSLEWTEELLAIAERIGDRRLVLDGHSWRMALLLENGDVAGMDVAFALSTRVARETNEPRALALVRRHEAARALIAGDFELAGRSLSESIELTNRLEADELSVMLVGALAFAIAWHQDELEGLLPAIREFADGNPEFPAWRCALACALARTGHLTEARRELEAARGDGFAGMPHDNLWLVGAALAAEAAHLLGDVAVAGELEGLLAAYADRNVVTPDGLYFGPVSYFRWRLAQTLSEHGAQEALREQARASATRLGAAPVLARLASEPDGAAAPVVTAPAATASLRREGDFWRVAYSNASFLLKDAKGLRHLARLLAEPDVELHVLDLGGGGTTREQRVDDDAGPALDAEAKAQYRRRIADLEEEIEEADGFNDTERAARARAELAFVAAELSSAVGLGGRDRPTASGAERARVNVTRQIRSTIDRIAEHDQALGRHLEGSVRTGTFCVYRPVPGGPEWELEA